MLQKTNYKLAELFILFVLAPISLVLDIPIWFKLGFGLLGFIYIIVLLLIVEKNKFRIAKNLNWKVFWKRTFIQLLIIAFLTTLYVWFVDKENLYIVVINKPKLWLFILFFYSAFSVYPQELIYRTFYFQRYQPLFKNENIFIIINAILFSLAHLFFRNTLVMILTFIGGILFALSYKKTKSTLLVSIEHAIYGCWLFTVGMGAMLGFPS
ncbi:CPBP family intramembrane glutamic endopeptidase [Winogradskyella immobilis]|uniref:CPBP family intramembrane metalloprotease n=1 Tax=Winogradskyella immobilis TaxID=2816852 RepID=A0ABS8EK91_9FLAO|nr:CPBP family intramembrane glutamic endopeptidase [Winogradskyella immobilis]MCC1483639.1 CPBP family intramembrane metalloprotease [Winogradskyella immobilis]MCG0015733.1 CPBP family intramembrane metalloprotease [Winogradskyella immobilis]